jgi:CD9 antigen/CD82 antigen
MGKFWHRVEFLRVILFILNIVFVLVGIAIIGIGIYIQTNNNFSVILNRLADTGNFEGQSLGFLAFVLIGGGVFTVLIAIVGCMGTFFNIHINCN